MVEKVRSECRDLIVHHEESGAGYEEIVAQHGFKLAILWDPIIRHDPQYAFPS